MGAPFLPVQRSCANAELGDWEIVESERFCGVMAICCGSV